MDYYYDIVTLEKYAPIVGQETIDRISAKARQLHGARVVHVNSTYYGGGVAELLGSLTLLMNSAGIETSWLTIKGGPDFFSVTKKMHNALQGGGINLTELKKDHYERTIFENHLRIHLDHEFVVVHDPQPLPLIKHYRKKGPWIWRCHIDFSKPDPDLWDYLKTFVERYDAAILTSPTYRQQLRIPQVFFAPAIDPFTTKNCEMESAAIEERLNHYHIPTDRPLVVQISRFDRWKDPEGVIAAFKQARKNVDCTLVLLGNAALDDPEGKDVYEAVLAQQEERILVLSHQDSALVNALQRRAAVVVQKSLREGFGLTVTEAMWKGTPVVGGRAGGIPMQIEDGDNGFLVSTVDETADRICRLLKDADLQREMGRRARETVTKKFLMTRLLEQYLDLFNAFETIYRLPDTCCP